MIMMVMMMMMKREEHFAEVAQISQFVRSPELRKVHPPQTHWASKEDKARLYKLDIERDRA